ncbi:MAG: hypothetical protein IJH55_03150 [Romboutsia sp.]|nr:hypothetical protein [Romboutsia sp.]
MKYVIMCGGFYQNFREVPKQLSVVNGERLVDRTIRLLKENGVEEIYISSNNPVFDTCGVPRLEHENSYRYDNDTLTGYWVDAFYPHFEDNTKVTYLFGDVYYTEKAINKIVNFKTYKNVLFGTGIAKNKLHKNWGEPFAYVVNDYKVFMDGVKAVKKLQDEGKTKRMALVWELYRYLNGLDINIQQVKGDTYICIDDGTIDIDGPQQIEQLNDKIKNERK